MLFLHVRTGYWHIFFLCIGKPHPVVGLKRSRCIVKNAPINDMWNDKLQDVRKKELMKQFNFYQRFYQINLFFPVHLDLK
jgi:hypothetical protein